MESLLDKASCYSVEGFSVGRIDFRPCLALDWGTEAVGDEYVPVFIDELCFGKNDGGECRVLLEGLVEDGGAEGGSGCGRDG